MAGLPSTAAATPSAATASSMKVPRQSFGEFDRIYPPRNKIVASATHYLDLQSTQNVGPHTHYFGTGFNVFGTLEVQALVQVVGPSSRSSGTSGRSSATAA